MDNYERSYYQGEDAESRAMNQHALLEKKRIEKEEGLKEYKADSSLAKLEVPTYKGKKVNSRNIVEYLLTELLAIHNMTIDDAKKDERWFANHEWTYAQSREFINKHSPILKKVLKCTKDRLEREWAWFALMYFWRYSTNPDGTKIERT